MADNYATHKHPKVKAWLAKNPRIHVHYTPASGSWLNLIELLLHDRHPPGHPPRHLSSVEDLIDTIEAYIDGWNQDSHPFTWTKPADEILAKLKLAKTKRH